MDTRGVAAPAGGWLGAAGSSLRKVLSGVRPCARGLDHRSPIDLFAEAVADPDRHRVHQQGHAEQDGAGGRCVRLERRGPDATPS